jgi:hypothetical protein
MYGLVDPASRDVTFVKEENEDGKYDVPVEEDIQKVLSLIFATKINLYQTNHHTGQGSMQGYLARTYGAFYTSGASDPVIITAIHCVGHWASTHQVLTLCGLEGLKHVNCIDGLTDVVVADDVKMRINSTPAGTANLSLAYNILRRYMSHPLAAYERNMNRYNTLISSYKAVMKSKARYHVSSHLLTGEARMSYDDSVFSAYLGILGTFINTVFPKSTLCNSPKIRSENRTVYTEYEDYDNNFESTCSAYVRAAKEGTKIDVSSLFTTIEGKFDDLMKAVTMKKQEWFEDVNEAIESEEAEEE